MADNAQNTAPGFGPFLQSLRRRRGAYQREIEAATGFDQPKISNWENKREIGYLPDPDVVEALARYYGVPQSAFVQAAGYLTDMEQSDADGNDSPEHGLDLIRVGIRLLPPSPLVESFEALVKLGADLLREEDAKKQATERIGGGAAS